MEVLRKLGDGSLLMGIFILPFAVSGLVLFIKGVFAYLETIDEKYHFSKGWQVGAFGAFLLLSYIALFLAVSRLL